MNESLLVELFTEELPPKVLNTLGVTFATTIFEELVAAGFVARTIIHRDFATPRRLAVLIPSVGAACAERSETKKLLPAKVGFDAAGAPSPALVKRLEKEGLSPYTAKLERRTEGDTEYVFVHLVKAAMPLASVLQSAIEKAIARLPIPKVMSYQLADGATTVQFVRPAHGLVALHGANIVPVSVLGLKAGNITHGHRFQGVKNITLARSDAYEETLAAEGKVVASFAERRSEIERGLREKAAALGASLGREEDVAPLLEEVSALVERPAVYAGAFDAEFLAVPQECLILTMRAHQKYFPLFDENGKLTNRFLIVSNMRLENPQHIIEGNERVVRPRLADARFFFETDKKTRLADRIPQLGSVVYHNKLGSQLERIERVRKLAAVIAGITGTDVKLTERAALLAKGDLVTNMVGEFPELQGIMGSYYALADDEDPRVATAIEEHYYPRFAGDARPSTDIGVSLALADKLETLAGMFGIGQHPSGDKDPFALRRHALGVLRILIEGALPLDLRQLLEQARDVLSGNAAFKDPGDALFAFMLERLRGYLRDKGYRSNQIEAVLALEPTRIDQVMARLDAVRAFAALPEAGSLAAANKRTANILKKAARSGSPVDATLLHEVAEIALAEVVNTLHPEVEKRFAAGDYAGTLTLLAQARDPVDAFFNDVMVMAEDAQLRANRLALLRELHGLMNRVADISKLAA